MTYAEAIKLLRKRLALTQIEFANMLGTSFPSVNRWESGKYEPTMKMKKKLIVLFKENNIVIG